MDNECIDVTRCRGSNVGAVLSRVEQLSESESRELSRERGLAVCSEHHRSRHREILEKL